MIPYILDFNELMDAVYQELWTAYREFVVLVNSRQEGLLTVPLSGGCLFEEHAVLCARMLHDLGLKGPRDYDEYLYAHDHEPAPDSDCGRTGAGRVPRPKTEAEYLLLNSQITDRLSGIARTPMQMDALRVLLRDNVDKACQIKYILHQVCKYAPETQPDRP